MSEMTIGSLVVRPSMVKGAERLNSRQESISDAVDYWVNELFGEAMREARKRKGVTLDQVKRRTKGFLRKKWDGLSDEERGIRERAYSRFCQCMTDVCQRTMELSVAEVETSDPELRSPEVKGRQGSRPERRCPDMGRGRRRAA